MDLSKYQIRLEYGSMLRQAGTIFGLTALLMAGAAGHAVWQRSAAAVGIETGETRYGNAQHDGQHDFDFFVGKWRIHNRRLLRPLTGSQDWVEFDGTSVARKIWDGRANMDEYEGDSPTGHIEELTVRIYNMQSHEWSEYWASSKHGGFSLPATVGHFTNGRGEFYDHEQINGNAVLVRFLWLSQSPKQCRWEQAFSLDEGKTWETNWTMDFTRVEETPL